MLDGTGGLTHANVVLAAVTPDIIRHLEPVTHKTQDPPWPLIQHPRAESGRHGATRDKARVLRHSLTHSHLQQQWGVLGAPKLT